MKLEDLSKQINEVNRSIIALLNKSGYLEYDELTTDEQRTQRKYDKDGFDVADLDEEQWLKVEEYGRALRELEKVCHRLTYLTNPVKRTETIHFNAQSERYGCDYHTFTCGDRIEFLRYEEEYDAYIWTVSSVEHNTDYGGYYIVGFNKINMDGLKVRFRW